MLAIGVNISLPNEPSFNNNVFDFKFKRIAHYQYVATQHLLTQYAHFLSRAAEEHDFSLIHSNENEDKV